MIRKLKGFFDRHERLLIPGALLAGVAVDFVTFRSIRVETAFLILGVHLLVAGTAVAYVNGYDAGRFPKGRPLAYARLAAPLLLQFSFGALLSASLIFYWFSGTLSVSWPFIGLIAILMATNEVFRDYYLRPGVQITVLSFIFFSIFSLVLPFTFNSVSPFLFVASGLLALAATAAFACALERVRPEIRSRRKRHALSAFVVFAAMNGLYVLNVIPPIPLSLHEAVMAHDLRRVEAAYLLDVEDESLLERILPGQTLHLAAGKRAYAYTAVFAPSGLDTRIVHVWRREDDETKKWIERSRSSFRITGGRAGGYRGYSFITAPSPGRWRVDVQTERGQVLGRVQFRVERAESPVALMTVER